MMWKTFAAKRFVVGGRTDAYSQPIQTSKMEFLANPAGNYMFKVNNRNTRTRCEIFSKLTIKTRRQWRRSGVFIVNFEHILRLALVFLLLTLSR